MGNYLFSLTPTFTQGLILGQLSILLLLYFILKYLFFDSKSSLQAEENLRRHTNTFSTEDSLSPPLLQEKVRPVQKGDVLGEPESAEWLNLLLKQVLNEYRCKLRADDNGPDGQKVVMKRVQAFANKVRPQSLLGPINVHSVNLGTSAPRLSNARVVGDPHQIAFDLTYTDTASISLSTSVLCNYPLPGFARLPLSLVISMDVFSSAITFTPPVPIATSKPQPVTSDAFPAITVTIPPSSISLSLKITSTMGSRAQLADVPKLHELIETQVKKFISEKGPWKVVLPGLGVTAKSPVNSEEDGGIDSL